jgi:hypothetical protein
MAIEAITSAPTFTVPRTLNLDPIIPVFRRILEEVDFLQPLKTAVDCLDSGPFFNVTLVSLKSAPYIYYGDKGIVKEFDNGVSCRLRYLETAVTSLAATVYNLVFGLIFSVLSLVTLGQIRLITDQMRKHWAHTALAVAALGISCAGTVSPDLGIKANLAGGFAIGVAISQMTQSDVISKISTAYQQHNAALKQAVAQACRNSGIDFNREFTSFFDYLDSHLIDRVKTFPEFADVVKNAAQRLPSILPTASTGLIINHLQKLAAHWRSSGGQSVTTVSVSTV